MKELHNKLLISKIKFALILLGISFFAYVPVHNVCASDVIITDFVLEENGKILKENDNIHISFKALNASTKKFAYLTFVSCIDSDDTFPASCKYNPKTGRYEGGGCLASFYAESRYKFRDMVIADTNGKYVLLTPTDCSFIFSDNCYKGKLTGGTATTTKKAVCSICGKSYGNLLPSVKLNTTTLKLQTKKSTTALKVTSSSGGNQISKWTSSNTKVATVNAKTGKITAKKAGTVYITVTMKSGATAKCKVTVQKGAVKTTKIAFTKSQVTLKKGQKLQLKITRNPITANDKLKYSSSNKKIVTVTSGGKITAKKKGTAYITVKAASGKKAKCKVVVK